MSKSKTTLYGILFLIIGFGHIFIPAWGIIIPDIGASFYWYWGFYFAGSGGTTDSGILADESIVNAGRTAITLMVICLIILTITLILAKSKKIFEAEQNISVFGIVWLILGIVMLIAPSIYLASVSDSIFDEYSWGIGIIFSYGLGFVPLLLGIITIYTQTKK